MMQGLLSVRDNMCCSCVSVWWVGMRDLRLRLGAMSHVSLAAQFLGFIKERFTWQWFYYSLTNEVCVCECLCCA